MSGLSHPSALDCTARNHMATCTVNAAFVVNGSTTCEIFPSTHLLLLSTRTDRS